MSNNIVRHICPVCGYDQLEDPPRNHNICNSCGTQFGYDDSTTSHEELRRRWVEEGMNWWSIYTDPPRNWDPVTQLMNVTNPSRVTNTNTGTTNVPHEEPFDLLKSLTASSFGTEATAAV